MTKVFEHSLTARGVNATRKKVAKIAKRMKKTGLKEPVMTVGVPFFETLDSSAQTIRLMEMFPVTITIEEPKIEGFQFVARLEVDEHNEVMIFSNPSFEGDLPKKFRKKNDRHCYHCGTNRRRKNLYVFLKEDTGEFVQIGNTCLANYFDLDPARLIAYAEALENFRDNDDEYFTNGYASDYFYPIDELLKTTAAVCILNRMFYRSKTKTNYNIGEQSTVDEVKRFYYDTTTKDDAEFKRNIEKIYREHKTEINKLVKEAHDWFDSLSKDGTDFEYNVLKAIEGDNVRWKHFSFACYGIGGALRARQQKAEKDANQHLDAFFGKIGNREQVCVRIIKKIEIDNQWASILYIMQSQNGHSIKVFHSGKTIGKEGDVVWITGTVKKHDIYKGQKQTLMNRVRLDRIQKEAA